jgi:exosome complex component RRP45
LSAKTNNIAQSIAVFIRQALAQEIRLDGRGLAQYREMELTLSRGEMSSRAEVTVGNTRVVSIVSAEIAVPYPDRPTDGILQFNAEVSPMSDTTGAVSRAELTRLLERSIRESDAIDTESLCIVGGEKVWMINCDVRVLDFSGGNVVDAAMFAAMGALKAFRKPEIAVQVASYVGNPANSTSAATAVGDLTIFSSDEREPLPLALHHTPLSVTLGIFKGVRQSGSSSSSSANTSSSDKDTVSE